MIDVLGGPEGVTLLAKFDGEVARGSQTYACTGTIRTLAARASRVLCDVASRHVSAGHLRITTGKAQIQQMFSAFLAKIGAEQGV